MIAYLLMIFGICVLLLWLFFVPLLWRATKGTIAVVVIGWLWSSAVLSAYVIVGLGAAWDGPKPGPAWRYALAGSVGWIAASAARIAQRH